MSTKVVSYNQDVFAFSWEVAAADVIRACRGVKIVPGTGKEGTLQESNKGEFSIGIAHRNSAMGTAESITVFGFGPIMVMIAGEDLDAGDLVFFGNEGTVIKAGDAVTDRIAGQVMRDASSGDQVMVACVGCGSFYKQS